MKPEKLIIELEDKIREVFKEDGLIEPIFFLLLRDKNASKMIGCGNMPPDEVNQMLSLILEDRKKEASNFSTLKIRSPHQILEKLVEEQNQHMSRLIKDYLILCNFSLRMVDELPDTCKEKDDAIISLSRERKKIDSHLEHSEKFKNHCHEQFGIANEMYNRFE